MNILSELLRKKRAEKGFQQKDMAYALNISPAAYSKIENGKTKISVELAKKMSIILEMPLSEFLEGKQRNIEINNGNNSPLAIENSTLIMQNEKLMQTQIKLSEQMITIMNSQNDLIKEMTKLMKNLH